MSADGALLALLQLSDSALPVGRFVHSQGLESWLAAHPQVGDDELLELVEVVVAEAIAPLDGVFLAHAHRASDVDRLHALDDALSARKLTPAARAASTAPGRSLAALAPQLLVGAPALDPYWGAIRRREADGNLAVVVGALAGGWGIAERDAVLAELRGSAVSLLSAAVRLGALAPTRAQVLLAGAAPMLARATTLACELPLEDARASAPEMELFGLTHRRADGRLFVT